MERFQNQYYLPISLNTSLFVGQDCLIMMSFLLFFSTTSQRTRSSSCAWWQGRFSCNSRCCFNSRHRCTSSETFTDSLSIWYKSAPFGFLVVVYMDHRWWVPPGSITIVRLTSCLTGLDLAALFMLNYIQIYKFGQIQTSQIGCQP